MTEPTPIFKSRRAKLPVLILTAAMLVDDLPVMLARRARRERSRSDDAVATYERKHAILAKGKR